MQNKKYEFTGEEKEINGRTLKRIRALVAIGYLVAAGDLGGWIESEKNLSVSGKAWVFGEAQVSGEARVSGKARVFNEAQVSGKARVFGKAWVFGEAQVSGEARVFGKARVFNEARVSITPIVIKDMEYQIDIDDLYVRAGCQQHKSNEWFKFKDSEIRAMYGKRAIDFYPTLKSIIESIAIPHQAKAKESE